jgi:hypothetical protein
MVIYYFEQDTVKYLLSYLDSYSIAKYETVSLNGAGLAAIDNTAENYLLCSATAIDDLPLLLRLLHSLRKGYDRLKLQVVCGGALYSMLDTCEMLQTFAEITHICVGKGEEFLLHLIEKQLPAGIYNARDFPNIRPYVVSAKYRLNKTVLLTFQDNRCSWGRCLFCHHQARHLRPIQSPRDVAMEVDYYVNTCGYENFFFYDNHLNPDYLSNFLELLYEWGFHRKTIRFYLFGIRADMDLEALKPILERWNPSPVVGGAWGVEFYDQEILNLYRKNIRLAQIDHALQFFSNYGIVNDLYLLLGLPGVRNRHIDNLQRFVDTVHAQVGIFRTSLFLLSDSLQIFPKLDQFGIRLKEAYTLRDAFRHHPEQNAVPMVKTAFLDFDSWDEDDQRYVSRDRTLEKYIGLFLNRKVQIEPLLCFVDLATHRLLGAARSLARIY